MFGWFSPKCPLDSWEQAWTETRMRWLADQFGIDRLLKAEVVLPDEKYLPGKYHATEKDARKMMRRLCGYMGADPDKLELEVLPDDRLPQAAGTYRQRKRRSLIQLAQSNLAEPQKLAATLAHEIAHELLLGAGVLRRDEPDHELVTDLLPVFLGVGVFAANSTVTSESWYTGLVEWWQFSRLGYLPSRMFGYAFALFAFMRGEEDPAWAGCLRLDASSALQAGLRYLRKTSDSLFHPDTVRTPRPPLTASAVVSGLRHKAASVRLASLWDLGKTPLPEGDVVASVAACLDDRDPHLPGEAARVLGALGPAASSCLPRLRRAARSANLATRTGAMAALGALRSESDENIAVLTEMLAEPNLRLVEAAAAALGAYGHAAAGSAEALLDALTRAVIACDDRVMRALCDAIRAVTPDGAASVRAYYADKDREVRVLALQVYGEQEGKS
jgi:hypothetical protein